MSALLIAALLPSSTLADCAIFWNSQTQDDPADRVHGHRRHGARLAWHGALAGIDFRQLQGIQRTTSAKARFL